MKQVVEIKAENVIGKKIKDVTLVFENGRISKRKNRVAADRGERPCSGTERGRENITEGIKLMNQNQLDNATAPRSVDQQQDCSALISLNDFQAEMAKLNGWAQHGCSDGGCQIKKPKGMHTNGGCRCHPKSFVEHLLWLACEIEKHGRRRWPNDIAQAPPAQNNQSPVNAEGGCLPRPCSGNFCLVSES